MAQTVVITLTTAGTDTGPFDLYSNIDGFTIPFESGIPKISLTSGYTSYLVPDEATIIRVQSDNALCTNYIDLVIGTITTTSSTSTTSTTSTTVNPGDWDYYLADEYLCGSCSLISTNVLVKFATGTSVTFNNYYQDVPYDNRVYKVKSISTAGPAITLGTLSNNSNCSLVECLE